MNIFTKLSLSLLVLLFPFVAFAQNSGLELPDNLDFLSGPEEPKDETKLDQIEGKVTDMQSQIRGITERFKNSSNAEQVTQLDNVALMIQAELEKIGPEGELGKEIQIAIKDSKDTMAEWRAEANNPENSPELRLNFEKLADKYEEQSKKLFEAEAVLYRAKKRLRENLKKVEENKRYIAAVLKLKDRQLIINALNKLTKSVDSISDDFDELTDDLTNQVEDESEETGSN